MNEEKSNYKLIDWNKLQNLCKILAKKIKESEYEPDVIIGISRGGWAISRLLCDYMGCKDIVSLDLKQDNRICLSFLKINLSEKRILLVDDVIDERSIQSIRFIAPSKPNEIRILALFYAKGTIKPDYYIEEILHKSIIFPWDFMDSIRRIVCNNLDEFRGMSAKRVKSRLKESFNIDVEEGVIEEVLRDLKKT
jgi:hypoxanthine phosphoribosyltransferase